MLYRYTHMARVGAKGLTVERVYCVSYTGSHANIQRLAYESKQRSAEVNRFVSGDRHVHSNEFLK